MKSVHSNSDSHPTKLGELTPQLLRAGSLLARANQLPLERIAAAALLCSPLHPDSEFWITKSEPDWTLPAGMDREARLWKEFVSLAHHMREQADVHPYFLDVLAGLTSESSRTLADAITVVCYYGSFGTDEGLRFVLLRDTLKALFCFYVLLCDGNPYDCLVGFPSIFGKCISDALWFCGEDFDEDKIKDCWSAVGHHYVSLKAKDTPYWKLLTRKEKRELQAWRTQASQAGILIDRGEEPPS